MKLRGAHYLLARGWRYHSGDGAHSYWIRPESHKARKNGRIYIRQFAVQIQREQDRIANKTLDSVT